MTMRDKVVSAVNARYGDNAKYILANNGMVQELDYLDWKEARGGFKHPDWTFESAMKEADDINEHFLSPATVKVGDGVSIRLWSDSHAATVIKVTKSTVTVRQDKATLDPNFKPEWVAGGFAGHCINQDEQSYTYEPDSNGHVETFRWSNKYGTYGQPGNARLTKGRHEFYDYNF